MQYVSPYFDNLFPGMAFIAYFEVISEIFRNFVTYYERE